MGEYLQFISNHNKNDYTQAELKARFFEFDKTNKAIKENNRKSKHLVLANNYRSDLTEQEKLSTMGLKRANLPSNATPSNRQAKRNL